MFVNSVETLKRHSRRCFKVLGSILVSILEQNRSQIDPQIESKIGRPAPLLEFLFAKHIFPQDDFFFWGGALLRRAMFSAGAFFFGNMSNPCQGPIQASFSTLPSRPWLGPSEGLVFTLAATARGKKRCFSIGFYSFSAQGATSQQHDN